MNKITAKGKIYLLLASLLLLIIALVFYFNTQKTNDLSLGNLKGQVRSITQTKYNAFNKFGEITKLNERSKFVKNLIKMEI